jgi:hypothetical protein
MTVTLLPDTPFPLVVRTDFSDPARWEVICAAVRNPAGDFAPHVRLHSDPAFDGLSAHELLPRVPQGSTHPVMFVVDKTALSSPSLPVLAMDLLDDPGRTFRVLVDSLWMVENNLSTGNMGFAELAAAVDEDGVLRG